MPGELIPIVLFVSMAAVFIFRPLTKKLGSVIESRALRDESASPADLERAARVMERLVERMDRLEERVDFAERLLEEGPRQRQPLSSPPEEATSRQKKHSEGRSP